MNQQYLIPANAKRGQLILSTFRPIDLAIALIGAGITFLLFLVVKPETISGAIMVLAPLAISSFLVLPVANYHNVLCIITNIYIFYTTQKKFSWKGWCIRDEYGE